MSLFCVLCIYSIVSIVRLSGNNLGDEGLDILTKSLDKHTRLQDLRFVCLKLIFIVLLIFGDAKYSQALKYKPCIGKISMVYLCKSK